MAEDTVIYRAPVAADPDMEISLTKVHRHRPYYWAEIILHRPRREDCIVVCGHGNTNQGALFRLGEKLEAIASQCREAAADIA